MLTSRLPFGAPLLAAALGTLVLLPACAQGGKPGQAEMEKVVREYILANPEIIEEALVALAEKERVAKLAADAEMIRANRDKLYGDNGAFFIGPADAKVTVVEFFDYRCGYCKTSVDWVRELPTAYDGEVRVVFKELPIFGGISETAALAALAAGRQGKYLEMHVALMGIKSNDDLTEAAIDAKAKSIGLDVRKMRADMSSQAVQKQLAGMKTLGETLGVRGTPGFFVGERYIEGANVPELRNVIEELIKG